VFLAATVTIYLVLLKQWEEK
jgi:hypothetical protein